LIYHDKVYPRRRDFVAWNSSSERMPFSFKGSIDLLTATNAGCLFLLVQFTVLIVTQTITQTKPVFVEF